MRYGSADLLQQREEVKIVSAELGDLSQAIGAALVSLDQSSRI